MLKLEIMIQFTFPLGIFPENRQKGNRFAPDFNVLQFIIPEVYDQLNRNWISGERKEGSLRLTHKFRPPRLWIIINSDRGEIPSFIQLNT